MVPVEHRANARQLVAEVGDGPAHHDRRVLADLQRVVLAVDAEGVEADGLEDVVPVQATPPPVDVEAAVGHDVADVQPLSRGVREHRQVVEGAVSGVEVGAVVAALLPGPLPLRLDARRVVAVELARGRLALGGRRDLGHGRDSLPEAREMASRGWVWAASVDSGADGPLPWRRSPAGTMGGARLAALVARPTRRRSSVVEQPPRKR